MHMYITNTSLDVNERIIYISLKNKTFFKFEDGLSKYHQKNDNFELA